MGISIYVATLSALGLTLVLSKFISYVKKSYDTRQYLLARIPAEKHHWFFGHLRVFPGFTEDGLLYFSDLAKKYPRYFLFLIGPFRTVTYLNHPETVKQLAKTAEPKSMTGGGGYRLLLPWIGEGLLVSSGAKWFRNRKMLTPGFHFDVLKPYVEIYNECSEILMDIFENGTRSGESIDIFDPVSRCTLDIILRCAFSDTQNVQQSKDNNYVKNIKALAEQILYRTVNPLMYIDFIYYRTKQGKGFLENCAISHKLSTEVINKRRETLKSNGENNRNSKYVDFLDILLLAKDEDGNGLSQQEILDEVETFMFEGHDTTASGISWILYNLARHPEVQTKAHAEIDALLDGRDNDRLRWADMDELPYLTQCIKESLRIHPPVPSIGRNLTKPLKIDGNELPIGAQVYINIWNVHHNPEVWPNPFRYDPDRFTLENMTKMDSHAFLPFSAGPRNCIGQNFAMHEMKTTVARVLRRFRLSLDTSKQVKMLPQLVLRAESGIHLFLEKRSTTGQ